MPTATFEYQTPEERRAIDAAIAFVTEMHQLARTAPPGLILGCCEQQALQQGHDLLRSTLQHAVQARIDADEQKGGPRAPARVADGCASKGAATAKR